MTYQNDKGSALVEMAFVLPLLILLVMGICEFGWVMYVNNTLNHAAREGARLAAVTPKPIDEEALQARVRERITLSFDDMDLEFVDADPLVPASSPSVTVTVTMRHNSFTPLFSELLDNRELHSKATMRYER